MSSSYSSRNVKERQMEKKYLLIYWRYITGHLKADIKIASNLTSHEVVEHLSEEEFEFRIFETTANETTGSDYEAFAANAEHLRSLKQL